MSEKKKQYWTADAILSANADINMVLGEKGNGKSYDIKYRFIKQAYENNEKFAYFCRYKEDIRHNIENRIPAFKIVFFLFIKQKEAPIKKPTKVLSSSEKEYEKHIIKISQFHLLPKEAKKQDTMPKKTVSRILFRLANSLQ